MGLDGGWGGLVGSDGGWGGLVGLGGGWVVRWNSRKILKNWW